MSVYEKIVGHHRQIQQLERARLSGRVAHAYLFFGPEGVGKEKVAFAFVQALNCTQEAKAPCGYCDSCLRIEKGIHPDVRLLASEETLVERGLVALEKNQTASDQIRNSQLDELAPLFRLRPYLEKKKAVVVVDAEKMNVNSQNRFLKTLEEPTADTVIILVCARPNALLATVRSRCQTLMFGPIARTEIQIFLSQRYQLEEERISALVAMSQGSLGRALELAEGETLEVRDQAIEIFHQIQQKNMLQILSSAHEVASGRDEAGQILDFLELWFRDILAAGLGLPKENIVNQDRIGELLKAVHHCSPRGLFRWIDQIRYSRSALRLHANPRMTLESLFLSMRYH